MKRFLGLKKKKKVKDDADLSYRPPSEPAVANSIGNASGGSNDTESQHHAVTAAFAYPSNNVSMDRSRGSHASSSIMPPPPTSPQRARDYNNNVDDGSSDAASDVTSGYRSALAAYADTIDPAFSNEDGMGGGGGTLRSRSGRVRGSAGLKNRGNLIPVFEDNIASPARRRRRGNNVAAAFSPESSAAGATVRQDRYDAYESLMRGERNTTNNSTPGGKSEATWAAIPEQPRHGDLEEGVEDHLNLPSRSASSGANSEIAVNAISFQPSRTNSSNNSSQQQLSANARSVVNEILSQREVDVLPSTQNDAALGMPSLDSTNNQQPLTQQALNMHQDGNDNSNDMRLDPTQSLSPQTITSRNFARRANSPIATSPNSPSNKSQGELMLQPDAIYEEHYGDAYVDTLSKYLYPAGYQSMRPRSGPWKLSIFIFLLFLWLSVFIVGHCYDRGQKEYNYYFDNADDAYLQEVDDDLLVMETRWCGSKPLYFMWLVSVWITVLSMSYCSIIGYVKVRDIAVANNRSQPPGMMGNLNGSREGVRLSGRSDYYVMVDNVSNSNSVVGSATKSDGDTKSEATTSMYASYQDGRSSQRHVPSIYQSDGTPQFWGGHIYRPTQAAVAVTNRP